MPYHHGDLRRAVLAAARHRLRTSPREPLSIRELARDVGVSANAPYRHFGDRQALLRAVAAEGFRMVAGQLGMDDGPAEVAKVWRRLAREEPALATLMTSDLEGAAGDEDLQVAIGEWLGQVARAIERGDRRADPEAVVQRAVACWAAVHGLTALQRGGTLAMIDEWLQPSAEDLAERTARR